VAENELNIELRDGKGKGAARKLRAAGRIPGIYYGAGEEAQDVALDPRVLDRLIRSSAAGINTLFDLVGGGALDGKRVLVKEIQRDPVSGTPLHADLYAVDLDRKVEVSVPYRLTGTAQGVKMGGIVDHALREVKRIAAAEPERYWHCDQYSNEDNWKAHYAGTAAEILEQVRARTGAAPEGFVCGVGTGGTITGVGRRLKEERPGALVGCVIPETFPGIEGLKPLGHPGDIVPAILDESLIDDRLPMTLEEAAATARLLAHQGLFVGPSSGADEVCDSRRYHHVPGDPRLGELVVDRDPGGSLQERPATVGQRCLRHVWRVMSPGGSSILRGIPREHRPPHLSHGREGMSPPHLCRPSPGAGSLPGSPPDRMEVVRGEGGWQGDRPRAPVVVGSRFKRSYLRRNSRPAFPVYYSEPRVWGP